MKLRFVLPLLSGVNVPLDPSAPRRLDLSSDIQIELVESGGLLVEVIVLLTNQPIVLEDGAVTCPPEATETAFWAGSVFANYILVSSGIDAFDVETFSETCPDYVAESTQEQERLDVLPQVCWNSIRGSVHIQPTPLTLGDFQQKCANWAVLGDLADTIRASDPIMKYRALYSAVEAFCQKEGPKFDRAVGGYTQRFDARLTPDRIQQLREIRNRCTHYEPKQGPHITNERLKDSVIVRQALRDMKAVVKILLDAPPSERLQ